MNMNRFLFPVLLSCLTACQSTFAEPARINSHTWVNIDRIVAIGDIHGDYENYIKTLQLAGLVNSRGSWTGGNAHMVQVGDIPDRGPSTRKIMDHIDKLAGQAQKKGGYVHRLLGNHEGMNVYGDLRYVTDEEYAEFERMRSKRIRQRYFENKMRNMEFDEPEKFAALPENYQEVWEAEHPLGWIEHQQAWNPSWKGTGEYADRAQELLAAVRLNGIVFVHGGISDGYADVELDHLTKNAHAELADFSYEEDSILVDVCGPFWYRGLSGQAPEATPEMVNSILQRLSAEAIVVGHTPTPAVVWPRYDRRVIQIDTGISKAYGGYPAYLEITPEGMSAGYPGGKIALPRDDAGRQAYLDELLALDENNIGVKSFRHRFMAPPEPAVADDEAESEETDTADNAPEEAETVPAC